MEGLLLQGKKALLQTSLPKGFAGCWALNTDAQFRERRGLGHGEVTEKSGVTVSESLSGDGLHGHRLRQVGEWRRIGREWEGGHSCTGRCQQQGQGYLDAVPTRCQMQSAAHSCCL